MGQNGQTRADMSQETIGMLQHMLGGSSTGHPRKQPTPAADALAPTAQPLSSTPGGDSIEAVFKQLAQALAVLSGAAELTVAAKKSEPNVQSLRAWVRPNCRQAEEAMHRLRELHVGSPQTLTELSQSLTTLVLAADLLCADKLTDDDMQECSALLCRNAGRAVASLYELHSQLGARSVR
jgi:hypothetical protein